MKYNVFIDGGEGTTGLKIHEYFNRRDDIKVLEIPAENRKDPDKRLAYMARADVSFLCLPDAAAKEIAAAAPKGTRMIDTSTAHRTDSGWTYGLPELRGQREKICGAERIANPGCHATGAIVLMRPVIEAGIVPADYPFAVTSVTGYSGGGKKMIAAYEAGSEDLKSPRQYGITQHHKHIPEIMKMTGAKVQPSFMPIVSGYYSGMQVMVPVAAGKERVAEVMREYYAGEELVTVKDCIDEEGFIRSDRLAGTNRLEIGIYGDDGNVLMVSTFDNLGKGASGAAVQNMNLMLGIDERKGLL